MPHGPTPPAPPQRMSRRALGRGLLATVAGATVAGARSSTGVPAVGDPAPGVLEVGMIGDLDDRQVSTVRDAGVGRALVEMSWDLSATAPGTVDTDYLDRVAAAVRRLRDAGLSVALNTGTMNAPPWVLELPGAAYVDQDGRTYREHPVANLVFGRHLRPLVQAHLAAVVDRLGHDVDLVRTGGSVWGELSYPGTRRADGSWTNSYWCFDDAARSRCPVPGFRPGTRGDDRAGPFLEWYLDELVEFQNWQVHALRDAGYAGDVAVLYPSHGMREGDAAAAVARGLDGSSAAEVSGEVQRGYDFARQVAGLDDERAVVYGTWGDNLEVVSHLAGLALARGLPMMAENGGSNSADTVRASLQHARREGLRAFYLVRSTDFFGVSTGVAHWADVQTAVTG